MKALQEAELRRLEETAAREAALEKQKQEEEERRKKQLEEEVNLSLKIIMELIDHQQQSFQYLNARYLNHKFTF